MKGKRKFCALLVSCAMLLSLMPTTVFAVDDDDTTDAGQETEVQAADIVIAEDGTATIVTEDATETIAEEAEPEAEAEPVQEEAASEEEAEDEAEEEEEPEAYVFTANSDSIKVEVTAPAGALPEDAELSVERYAEDSDEYKEAADAIGYEEDDGGMAALDISFISDGQEVEPSESVKVSIDVSQILPSDADASTIEVQHIEESAFGLIKNATVVANESDDTKGTIDEEKATAEFEVDSFSEFTVTWTWSDQGGSETSVSITVTAYLDNQELSGLDSIEFDSQDDELNLETMLNEEHFGTSDYVFNWAYVTYTQTQGGGPGGGTGTTTIGSQDDPVEAIEKTSGGQSSFIIIQSSGTSTTVQSSYNLHLYAYYVTPTFSVEITPVAEDEAEDWLLQATLSHAGDYESVEYVWSVTGTDGSETSLAEVEWGDETGRAFIIWDEGVQNFDEVVVHVTATITRADGSTASASASYTLEYGDEYVNLQMTYGPANTALGAGVSVKLTNTVTGQIYERTTDASGQILSLEIVPGIYLVEASTTIGGSNYSCSVTVSMSDAGTYTINLNYADAEKSSSALNSSKTDWNHVDIKLATGTTGSDASSEGVTLNVTDVVIKDSLGNTKYTANSTSIAAGASDNEWQVYFYTGTDTSGSYSHTINFATTDSITITYTLQWEGSDTVYTYTVTIDADSTYVSGTTYPANGQRAYKIYNYLYGTNYSSNAQLMAAGVDSIDIGGMSMMLVAAILCDSSTVNGAGDVTGTEGMWGMDFALSVEGFASLSTSWMYDIEKTYVNHAMQEGDFTFYLYDAAYDNDTKSWSFDVNGWGKDTMSNSEAGREIDGNSYDTIEGLYITFDDDIVTQNRYHYYILCEDQGYLENTTYDGTVFGAAVYVGIDEVTGEPVVNPTYYTLKSNGDDTYTATEYTGDKITIDEDGYPTFHFTNDYQPSGSVNLGITKTISGISSTSNPFAFDLYEADSGFNYNGDTLIDTKSTTGTLIENEAQSVIFDTSTIQYTESGTYYYVIKESTTSSSGWTCDSTVYDVTVNVTADDESNLVVNSVTYSYVDSDGQTQTGSLTADENGVYGISGENTLSFANAYNPEPTSIQFTGSKYITNSASDENKDKEFKFELYSADSSFTISGEAIQTKTTTGAGTISFDEIKYEETGTYYYVIKEVQEEAAGWTMSETVYNITVEVTDDGLGQLGATVTVNGTEASGTENVYGGFDFTNAYAAEGAVTLGVVKSISGVVSTDKTFSFTLYNSDESFATGDSIETITTDGTITNSTQLNFTAIPYTKAGTYYYVITETGTAPDGWTLDTKEYHVTVTVTDNGDGTLTTSASYAYTDEEGETQTGNAAAFTNTYAATGSLSLTGTKTFEGGTLTENGFTFTMTDNTGESVGDVTMDASGTITFPTLEYDETDIGGEYTYTITESVDSRGGAVQYDNTTYTVVVSIADNGDGTLDITYTVNDIESGDITFTNYQKGSLTISKTFTGLTEEQIESLTDYTITVTNSDDETVATLTLNNADEGSSYTWTVNNLPADTYTVTESGYSLDGYEVAVKSGEVTVTNGSDVSVDDALAWGGEDTVEFANDYTEVGSISISKYVVAETDIQEAHEDTEYTIVITANEGANFTWVTITSDSGREITPTIEGNTITFTITENETVTIDGLPVGEYTVEEQGSDAMTSEHCVPTYIVGDEETEEAPTVTVVSGSENVVSVEIENEYPVGTYIQVQKDYNKDEYPTDDDAFTFTIEALTADLDDGDTLDAKDMPMPENSTVAITSSDESHVALIQFNDPDHEFEHFGTYYYKITETKGTLDNVEYDESVHYVKVVISFDENTHVVTTDEWEARADAETDDYKDLDYTEAGIVTAKFTNTSYEELSIKKEVSGNAGDTSEYEFEITLMNSDGTPFEGTVSIAGETEEPQDGQSNFLSNIVNAISGAIQKLSTDDGTITFVDGKATVTVTAGEKITILVPSGVTCTITEVGSDADSVNVSVNGVYQAQSSTTEATADVGTVADSTQVVFVNSYRHYFPIDEEIVTDEDDIFDKDAWVKEEAVNEYNAIEIEMTTNLPVITAYDLENGEFTMNFHEVLDHELVLDEDTADFSVYIGEQAISTAYYRITFDDDTGDGCNFHVDVDLTALYNAGVVTEDMLDGNTEITIFFFADLEGTGLNGSYTSTIWYEIYDGYEDGELLYISDESVVAVYTYEIEILKYDSLTGKELSGATFGIYYDEECTDPVLRSTTGDEAQPYQATSGDDGMVIFYGLADGTYYVKELEAPQGYALLDDVVEVELGEDLNDKGYVYETEFENMPIAEKAVDVDGDGEFDEDGQTVNVGDTLIYEIGYYNTTDEETTIIITDTLDAGLDFVSASDDGSYDEDSRTVTWTLNVDAQTGGVVTLTVVVNEAALTENTVENTATIQIGENAIDTNTTDNPIPGETRDISGSKTWDDNNDKADARPDSITVNLYQNGDPYDSKTVTAADGWAWSWTGLPACDEDGNAYAYTINEDSVEYYTPSYESGSFDITNTFVGEEGAEPTSGPTQGGDNPKTGDTGNYGVWLALLVAAMACMLVGFRMRKRN